MQSLIAVTAEKKGFKVYNIKELKANTAKLQHIPYTPRCMLVVCWIKIKLQSGIGAYPKLLTM